MSEISKYEAQKKKLEGLCEEHDLTFRLNHNRYPITLAIRPIQGVGEQLSLLEQAEEEAYTSPDASMTFVFADSEIVSQTLGRFAMSESLRNKIKIIFEKLVRFWCQYFFRDLMERNALVPGSMPVIDESEEDDKEEETGAEEGPGDVTPDEDLFEAAKQLVRMENKCTIALLQRRLKLGYSKASQIVSLLEERGIVGPYKGSEPREVLPTDVPEEG